MVLLSSLLKQHLINNKL